LQIEVTVRNASVQDDMRDYADKKAQRLVKYFDRLQSIHVLLDMDGLAYSCEMIACLEHMHELVGKAKESDIRAAIDQAVDRLERQLHEHKDRVRNRKGRGPNPHQPTRA